MVGGSVASSVLLAVELGEGSDSDVLSEVDVSGDGGCERAIASEGVGGGER